MFDILKKSMLTGIGMALKTRDEVEELAKDWAGKQKLSEDEGRKFMEELLKKYDSSVDKLEDKVEETVKKVLKKMNLVTQEEVDELKKEIGRLKAGSLPVEGTKE
ncbi:Poly(hydroxyalcanoate) granule associated protein domain-containing protein [Desulfonema limicola]|uniref:Poly(Hydroxyalcanoate) granule associated protein domain-containing protein n=1 Tax=Desulfonema limicola TaxID=45656 RepID=A0A975B7A7_9BACT|nr:phasin family protein [Desulfonema limicola]QTA80170.1 Poly(hydroxyalcanoate) granule associated protein domain-containing protein [Desulfonema limicola]